MNKVEEFEKAVKKKFIEEPGQMKLLIVVDKLLTGFDAPPATYLYIDKQMRDHGLFQAICRVNRLDGEDKEYGYIIDYKDLFKSLEGAVQDYTSGRSGRLRQGGRGRTAGGPLGKGPRAAGRNPRSSQGPVRAGRSRRGTPRRTSAISAQGVGQRRTAQGQRAEAAGALQARGGTDARLRQPRQRTARRPGTPRPRSTRSRPRWTTTRRSAPR